MLLPDALYSPQARDLAQYIAELVFRFASDQAIGAARQATAYTVPGDSVFILKNARALGSGGGVTNLTQLYIAVADGAGQVGAILANMDAGGAANLGGNNRQLNWTGEVWVPGTYIVTAVAGFDNVGLGGNLVRLDIAGVKIPQAQVR